MDFDVVIIGSGAGGGFTAHRLCHAGLKVGLIERGPRFDHRQDFVQNHADWDTREDPLDQARREEQTIDPTYKVPYRHEGRTQTRAPFEYHRVHGVGGSTLHYQGEAHRFAEHAFEIKTRYGWGLDWPIGYNDLAPYYQQAEDLLGVAGNPGNPFKPARSTFPTPAHSFSHRSQLLAQSATRAGFTLEPNTLALPSVSVDGRVPCQHSGGCNYGCVFGAKSSVDQAIIPPAEATGNLTLLTETRATRLQLDDNGHLVGVLCNTQSGTITVTARKYVLAGGALETPRLMLISTNRAAQAGVGNQHDQVGRYFMETVTARLQLQIQSEQPMYTGPPLDSRVWDFYRPSNNDTCGFVLGSAGFLYPSTGPTRHALNTPGIGRKHKQQVRNTFGQSVMLFGVAEQEPVASNHLTLSNKTDADGIPRLNVHCVYSKRDIKTVRRMHSKLNQWANATANAQIKSRSDTQHRAAATHVAGACRMGDDPRFSVVDPFGKVHGQRDCYITDGSVMPTQGAGDSPSLTIQALALRTADKLIDDLKSI